MIEIPEKSDLTDLERKLEGICRYLKIKLITVAQTQGVGWKAVEHWPFEGGFPREPLHRKSPNEDLCGMSWPARRDDGSEIRGVKEGLSSDPLRAEKLDTTKKEPMIE